jgi:hypothetical protein
MINALIAFSVERGVLQAIVQAGEVLSVRLSILVLYEYIILNVFISSML